MRPYPSSFLFNCPTCIVLLHSSAITDKNRLLQFLTAYIIILNCPLPYAICFRLFTLTGYCVSSNTFVSRVYEPHPWWKNRNPTTRWDTTRNGKHFNKSTDQKMTKTIYLTTVKIILYPGVAQLVARLLWEQDAGSSSLPTRTNFVRKAVRNGGFSAFIA